MKKLNLMSPVKLTGVITLLACLFFLAGAAGATVIYDNLSAGTEGPWSFTDGGGPLLSDSFSTGAGGFILQSVELMVQTLNPSTGSFSVGLYSDSSTSPGSLLMTIGTVSDSTLAMTPLFSVETLNLTSPYSLAAGTRYWVGLYSNTSAAAWMYSYGSGVGLAGEYWADSTGVYANYDDEGGSSGPLQMRVSGVVPLPPSALFLGSGLLGLVGWRRFRKSS